MIDKENEVFTRLREAILAEYSDASVTATYVNKPSSFPHVSIEQSDSYTPIQYVSSAWDEEYAQVMYTVNVYSNKVGTAKSEAKAIMKIVCDEMHHMNLFRESLVPTPNENSATVYRLTARFEGIANADGFYSR